MSDGGGQLIILHAVAADGTVSPSAKLYHYAAGTTTLKNIYSDEDLQTTLAQPFVSDAAGRFVFYASGDFKFRIDTSADVTLDTWDNFHVSTGQAAILEAATAYPAASAANAGHIVPKIVSGVVRGLGICNGSAFEEAYIADASGNQQINSVVSKTMPVYNIQHADWGASPGVASDQTTAIQSAITAIVSVGGGVLYCPQGTYQVDGTLDINNTSIKIVGDGAEHTIFKQTADPAAAMIDFDSNNQDDKVVIEGISFTTTVVGSTSGIDVNFTNGAADDRTNLYINDVYVGPHSSASATAYFDDCILATGNGTSVQKPVITNTMVSGHDTLSAGSNGISVSGASYSKISNVTFQNLEYGLRIDYIDSSTITGNVFRAVSYGIHANESTLNNTITGNAFRLITINGITLNGPSPRTHTYNTITGNTFQTSTDTCVLIYSSAGGGSTSNTITGNALKGVTGGSSTGIRLDVGSDTNVIVGNSLTSLDNGMVIASDNNIVSNNLFLSVTTHVVDTGTNIYSGNTPQTVTVPSAAALGASIPGAKYIDFWSVTGTTNVTSMHSDVDSPIGRIVTLKFGGVLTFTDGNNLLIDGNFVTADTDIIRLQFDGTNWNELSRSANST
jgi:hypothetical protein